MNDKARQRITVIGAGSWGTALAILLAKNGIDVLMWGNEPEQIQSLIELRENVNYIPGVAFPKQLSIAIEFEEAISFSSTILIAVPSKAFPLVLKQIKAITTEVQIISATKGLEPDKGRLLHHCVAEMFGDNCPFAVLSGPTFAKEVAVGLPTAITVASNQKSFGLDVANWLHNAYFRAYTSDDLVGVQIGGAVKNVLAIAAGIADGLGFGANTRAALITRGMAEIIRIGEALGGNRATFMGLSGFGDLVLTCTDNQSRNRRLGVTLARGKTLKQALADIGQAVEGVSTAQEIYNIAKLNKIEMPIIEQTYYVLYQGRSPLDAVNQLLSRQQKPEF